MSARAKAEASFHLAAVVLFVVAVFVKYGL